ncbi:lytic transglycosylase domain-containing protein [Ferruginibacter albus]|uniref:lytic transglycosylase domain-containing protein n=1 Tax=Ferruginibacter albus TaxID=2875540 RepID=UPI001CC39930|nr:lytic transglycosylase domain-containing protein [Ferruginibacter albus]UAY52402.1 lytic transglycosylase domain-containing protein [Ferruginibacter albus]
MNNKTIILLFAFLLFAFAEKSFSQSIDSVQPGTIVEDTTKEDALIKEVVKSSKAPKKDKVQYFSQVTKYGFKNLFSNYNYNSNIPYTSQVNPNAENFIQDYMKSHGTYLQKMKDWGQPYFTLIENVLQQYGLPHELKYVAVIESNLQTQALSNKGACGPWQLMPGTARQLGLTINNYVDERTDYYKSTNAAAKYLLSLYGQFHDWLLVMAAYNGGAGRVSSAIKKCGSNNFWNLQFYLPEESRTYVKRFIATHYIMEGGGGITTNVNTDSALVFDNSTDVTRTSYNSIGVNPYYKQPSLTSAEKDNVQTMNISGKYNAAIIAKNLSMSMETFDRYNPGFAGMISSIGNYDLRLPADKMDLFVANKYQILNESVQALLGGLTIPDTKTVYPKKSTKAKVAKRR